MMKKMMLMAIITMVLVLSGCGNKAMEDLQANYDRLSTQYDNLQADYDRIKADYDKVKEERDELLVDKNYTSDLQVYLPNGFVSTYEKEKRKFEILTEMAKLDDEDNANGGGLQPDGSLKIGIGYIEEMSKLQEEWDALWQ